MSNSDRLSEVLALMAERDEEFSPIERAAIEGDNAEPVWRIGDLKTLLGYSETDSIERAVNRAKVAAKSAGIGIKDHFLDGTLFKVPGEVLVTKYAALLIALNADPSKPAVAKVQSFFALSVNKEVIEEEKRLRLRMEVLEENKKLSSTAKGAGVQDFARFNGEGYKGLYGGKSIDAVARMKGLSAGRLVLEYAGSEELAANLFRITQTKAALVRDKVNSEQIACSTHHRVGAEVRAAIKKIGGTMPEALPPANDRIDPLITRKRRELVGTKRKAS